jgi:hypothetical protein
VPPLLEQNVLHFQNTRVQTPIFSNVNVSIFSFLGSFFLATFICLLAITFSVLRFTSSDYSFCIFKLFSM